MAEPSEKPLHSPECRITRVPLLARKHKHIPLLKNVLAGAVLMMLGEICAEEIKFCFTNSRNNEKRNENSEEKTNRAKNKTSGFVTLCKCWQRRQFSISAIDVHEVCKCNITLYFGSSVPPTGNDSVNYEETCFFTFRNQ